MSRDGVTALWMTALWMTALWMTALWMTVMSVSGDVGERR